MKPPPLFTSSLQKAGYQGLLAYRELLRQDRLQFRDPQRELDVMTDWTRGRAKRPVLRVLQHRPIARAPDRAAGRGDEEEPGAGDARPAARSGHDAIAQHTTRDTPVVRRDLANYYDLVTAVDHKVGDVLDALDRADVRREHRGHSDRRPRPRSCPAASGTGLRPRSSRALDRPLAGPDPRPARCATTWFAFSICRRPPWARLAWRCPREFQGQIILGPKTALPPSFLSSRPATGWTRRLDRIRSVRESRFHYIRNYHPELPYAQRVAYGELMPTLQGWRPAQRRGETQSHPGGFLRARPSRPRSLYDTETDPDEVHNLAADPRHLAKLEELREALDRWIDQTHDLGAVPERELIRRGLVADSLAQYESRKVDSPATKP